MGAQIIKFSRLLLIGFYAFAGSYHFINPEFYYPLVPDYLPYPEFINYASGFIEILIAIGIIFPKTRLVAVKVLILLLLTFVPSHVFFITEGGCMSDSLCVPLWVAWIRLILVHPLLIIWAWSIRKINL